MINRELRRHSAQLEIEVKGAILGGDESQVEALGKDGSFGKVRSY